MNDIVAPAPAKTRGFAAACKEFFGMKTGQTLGEFQQEIKALTFPDKREIAAGLRKAGINCDDPIAIH